MIFCNSALDTNQLKDDYSSRLLLNRKQGRTPRYIHFGELPEADFKELCSESKVLAKNSRTQRFEYQWVTHGKRNELLDTTIYCLATIEYFYGHWTIDQYEEQKRLDLNTVIRENHEQKRKPNVRNLDPRREMIERMNRGSDNFGTNSHSDNFGEPFDFKDV